MMNSFYKAILSVSVAAALVLAPETIYAQSRGGGGASRSSSASVSRGPSGGGASRSAASPSPSSGSSRSSASVSRQTQRSASSQQRSTRSSGSVQRSTSQQRSSASRSTSSQSRQQGNVSRSSSSSRSTAAPSRSTTQSGRSSSVSRSTAQPSRSTASPGRSASQSDRAAVQPSRQAGSANGSRPARTVTPARPQGSVGGPQRGDRPGAKGELHSAGNRAMAPNRVPPRERDFIEHGHAKRFFNRGPHHFGYRVRILPAHYVRRTFWGIDYFICDGIYYRYWDSCYHICRPPFGIFFDRALYDLELVLCDIAFYNTVNRAYREVNQNYETIAEQNAIIAENNATIAAQNMAIAAGSKAADESYNLASKLGLFQSYANAGQQYYYDDGIFFIEDANGQYKTIVPPAGALISELPDDYEIVVLDGQEYYQVDDTIYRTVVVNGKACFEVLGQIN